jgi:hypothetical protein
MEDRLAFDCRRRRGISAVAYFFGRKVEETSTSPSDFGMIYQE